MGSSCMKKVLFIQKQLFPYFGILSLSGFLKQHGYSTSVLIDSQVSAENIKKNIRKTRPDLIAFSLMSTEHNWFLKSGQFLKDSFPEIPILVGGIHAILYPEELAALPFVDYVSYGEGENTVLQLLQYFEHKIPIEEVKGIFFKKNDRLCSNNLNRLIELEGFREDRKIYYDQYSILRDMPLKVFISSRGCPYYCTFCANSQLQKNFKGLGNYVRRKNVKDFIAEIEEVKENYKLKSIFIADDLFVMDKNWLAEFSALYKKRIGVPYICTCWADMLDEESVRLLSSSGCHTVTFGVETGNEELRTKVLGKKISNEQILKVANMLSREGLKYQTSNMFCLPTETIDDAIKTIDFNIKIRASYTMSAIFLPFPKTELTNLCIKMGILKSEYSFKDMPHSFITHSVLSIKNKDTIERLQKVANICIQYPRIRNIMIFMAKNIKCYFLHFVIYIIGTIFRFRAERKMNLFDTVCYVWSYRKSV